MYELVPSKWTFRGQSLVAGRALGAQGGLGKGGPETKGARPEGRAPADPMPRWRPAVASEA